MRKIISCFYWEKRIEQKDINICTHLILYPFPWKEMTTTIVTELNLDHTCSTWRWDDFTEERKFIRFFGLIFFFTCKFDRCYKTATALNWLTSDNCDAFVRLLGHQKRTQYPGTLAPEYVNLLLTPCAQEMSQSSPWIRTCEHYLLKTLNKKR